MPATSTTCPQCGATFTPTRAQQRYCTPACTRRWNKRPEIRAATAAVTTYATTCAVCGTPMTRHVGRRGSATQPACSPRCKGWLATGWPDAPRASVITWATCACGQAYVARPTTAAHPRTRCPRPHASARRQKPYRPVPPRPPQDCAWCGRTYTPSVIGAPGALCSRRCARKMRKVSERGVRHGAAGHYTGAQLTRLHLDAGRRCAYCDRVTSPAEPDHVVPLARGGDNSIGNIVPACRECNQSKRDLLLPEWAVWLAAAGREPRRTVLDRADARFAHLHPVTGGHFSPQGVPPSRSASRGDRDREG